jgi:hypothetical protein
LVTDPVVTQAMAPLSRGHSLFAGGVVNTVAEGPARVNAHPDQLSHAVTRSGVAAAADWADRIQQADPRRAPRGYRACR